jgi:peptide/nickel transport system ATP-binding protein
VASSEYVVEVKDLLKSFAVEQGMLASLFSRGRKAREIRAVDGVSFAIRPGEILGLAGESGSGKSTTGMTVSSLYQATSGQILIEGQDLTTIKGRAGLKEFRKRVQIVFQNPYEALNPRMTVFASVEEPLMLLHPGRAGREARFAKVVTALERAGLVPVENFLERYPHQLSGGQLQRVALARAISVEPRFLIADEPVSMLDISIRAGVLNLLKRFSRELDMGILYISHDLSTMAHVCARVAIMYLGRIVEIGPADQVLFHPKHPYAQALASAIPLFGEGGRRQRVQLSGAIPSAANIPDGCRFHPRCPKADALCARQDPMMEDRGGDRSVACHHVDAD